MGSVQVIFLENSDRFIKAQLAFKHTHNRGGDTGHTCSPANGISVLLRSLCEIVCVSVFLEEFDIAIGDFVKNL